MCSSDLARVSRQGLSIQQRSELSAHLRASIFDIGRRFAASTHSPTSWEKSGNMEVPDKESLTKGVIAPLSALRIHVLT